MNRVHSVGLLEADIECHFSEGSPVDHEAVLSDESFLVARASAVARILSVFTWVGVILVGHGF